MNCKIYDLWDEFIEYGYNIRDKNKDGLAGWNSVKELIPDLSIEWTEKSKTYYSKLIEIGVNSKESPEEAGMTKEQWERHHYILQHGRIINKNPDGKLVRLLQIAYNAGQFKKELEKEAYPSNQMKYYIENELNKVTSYIEKIPKLPNNVVTELRDKFKSNLTGGHRQNYEKYFEYYINNLKHN